MSTWDDEKQGPPRPMPSDPGSRGGSGVLVVTNDFPPRRGGIESFVSSLCAGLPADGLVVYTATMPGSADTDSALPYLVVRDRAQTLLPTRRVSRAVEDVARAHGCDRVLFGAAAPLGVLAAGLRRSGAVRIVALTHGHEAWWASTPGARRLLRRIGEQVDALTYVSEYCRGRVAAALSADAAQRMVRLAPDIDLDRFSPAVDGSSWRARWAVGSRPVVLAASRLVRRKGHDVLLRCWPSVLRRCPDAVLVVVGDGPMRGRLQRTVDRTALSDSVRLEDGVPWVEMPSLYAAADVFALPCRTRRGGLEPEALGIVFLEAAASGLPVVVGASGGAAETIVDGVTGHLVDPTDPGAVADAISSLLSAPGRARRLGVRGRDAVAARFGGAGIGVLRQLLDIPPSR